MRFDDRLETTLRNAAGDGMAASTQWRQLVDILAQDPVKFPISDVMRGLKQARALIPQTKPEDRLASVNNLFGRIKSAPLVQLLAADEPNIVAAAIAGAKLTDSEWADIVPHLPVRARGFLRNRSDLGVRAKKALAIWAAADFVLPYHLNPSDLELGTAAVERVRPKPDAIAETSQISEATQIGAIVARIEQLRVDRERKIAPQLPFDESLREQAKAAYEIRFETDDVGTICWAEGVPEGAIVGIGIAEPAFDAGPGPDAYGASAFRQRMPLENARMRLLGSPIVEGDWRINAAPFFDPKTGRFRGYRGILRRPTIAESPKIEDSSITSGDQIQQLVH